MNSVSSQDVRLRERRHRIKSESHSRYHAHLRDIALKQTTQVLRDAYLGLAEIEACEARRNKQWADLCAIIAEKLEDGGL